jgi:hypothetical protein
MKRAMTMLSALAVVCALALPSWAQVKELPTDTKTIAGTIETINNSTRVMRIKTDDGKLVPFYVPEKVQRFNEFKVGDKLKVTYNNSVIVRLKPPGEAAVNTADPTYAKGATSGTAETVRRMTATIVELDRNASSITFAGPDDWKYSRRIADPTVFDKVKVGDRVDIVWNTDLTIARE